MASITKMIDTAGDEILVERMFDPSEIDYDREQSLIRIYQMQFRDATGASQETANEFVLSALEAGKIRFA